MPLFALEQIVLLSFAGRERVAEARLRVHARAHERRRRRRGSKRTRREVISHGSPDAFPAVFCLPSLEARGCARIPALITAKTRRRDQQLTL